MSGCGRLSAEDMIKDTVGGLMDEMNKETREIFEESLMYGDGDGIKVMSSKWPSEIPKEFVEFKYGRHIQTAHHYEDKGWTAIYAATMEEIEKYEKDLTKAGWIRDESFDDWASVAEYNINGSNTHITIGEPDGDVHYVTLYLDYDKPVADNNGIKPFDEEITIETDEVSHEITGEIPDGYPEALCPIYKPSVVIMAMKSTDDDFTGYTVGLLTMDNVEEVKNFYLACNPQNTSDMDMMAVYIFEAENGVDYASVSIMANPDEADKEFETSITITASVSK